MTTDVKTQFTQQEAIAAILSAAKDGGLPLEDRLVLLCGIVREQQDQIAQEQQTNALLLAWFQEFRRLVCKAAWALAMPGSHAANLTGVGLATCHQMPHGHMHELLNVDARAAFAALAALDDSGYAPRPENAGPLVEGTGVGDVAPRYEEREGVEP